MRAKEYYFKEGCYIEEWHNTPDDDDLSVARVRVAARTTTKLHALKDTIERYVMLEGNATVTVGKSQRTVAPGDVVLILPGQAQCIANDGDDDLIFLAICVPRFREQNYQELS